MGWERRLLRGLTLWLALGAGPAWGANLLVDVLDIGQGDSVLIRQGETVVLIDTGDRDANTVDQLKRLGVDHIDLLISTHPHADHIGRTEDVLRTFPVKRYVDNGLSHETNVYKKVMEAVSELSIPYQPAKRDFEVRFPSKEARLTVLLPDEPALTGTRSDLNSNSVVVLLEHGAVKMLFTGDSEEPTEQRLLDNGVPDVDVLKVAHHGSGHSSTSAFLSAVQPEIALISCGASNKYGHPDDEALKRLKSAGAAVYRTDLSGHLRVVSTGRGVEVLEGTLEDVQDVPLGTPRPVALGEAPEPAPRPRPTRPPAQGDGESWAALVARQKAERRALKAEQRGARQAMAKRHREERLEGARR